VRYAARALSSVLRIVECIVELVSVPPTWLRRGHCIRFHIFGRGKVPAVNVTSTLKRHTVTLSIGALPHENTI